MSGGEYTCVFSEECGLGVEERQKLYEEYTTGVKIVGDIVYTVRFQERFDSGLPQFPTIVGECPPESKKINGKSLRDVAKLAYETHNAEILAANAKKAAKDKKKK